MQEKDIQKFKDDVSRLIGDQRTRQAIALLRKTAREARAHRVVDRLDSIEQSYRLMLHYLTQGVPDPERDKLHRNISQELYTQLDQLTLMLSKTDQNTQYYSLVRLFDSQPKDDRIPSLLARHAQLSSETSLFSLLADSTAVNADKQRDIERAQSDLFTAIWATPWLSATDAEALSSVMRDEAISADVRSHLVSALLLGLLQMYDARKLDLLLDAYASSDTRVRAASLVGIVLTLWRHARRPLDDKTQYHLSALTDTPDWASDLKTATIELIRARDTERINRKIADEVIPEMLNLRPDMMKKINEGALDPSDLASIEENPEWKELLDKNGITDKLKELTEMQMEGADVMMSTFAHLKSFPFFNDIANWFLPYSSTHTSVAQQAKELGITSDMVENAMFMCDSDKYSFMFAIAHVPDEQRRLLTSQFQAQSDGIYEAMSQRANDTRPQAMQHAVNSYVQNIYRFFKLYRRSNEFTDPFDGSINLIAVPALSEDFRDTQLLRVVAEFYIKLGYWSDALDVMEHLETMETPDAQMRQKMGYCCERLGMMERAAQLYEQASLLDAESNWTLRRMASAYRALGDRDRALDCYRRLSLRLPDDLSVTLMLGYAYLEKGNIDEALHQFYKVEYLEEKSPRSWRPLAWTLFLKGDFEASRRYYDQIAIERPTSTDYLNMGHLALAMRQPREAINYYTMAVQHGMDVKGLLKAIDADLDALRQAGIDLSTVPMIADAVLYNLE